MNEITSILKLAAEAGPGEPLAMATLVRVVGSAYRRVGARTLIANSGKTIGMISGGCLENDIRERAEAVMANGKPILVTYDSTSQEDIIFGLGLGCNGLVQVLIERFDSDSDSGLSRFYHECLRPGFSGRLATVFESGAGAVPMAGRTLVWPDGRVTTTIPDAEASGLLHGALHALEDRHARVRKIILSDGSKVVALLETIAPPTPLLIFGGGADAVPLAHFAKLLGWQVTVVDARPAYALPERFPMADAVRCLRPEAMDIPAISDSLIMVMTHSYQQDKELLRRLLPRPLPYLGVLGPKARTRRILDELEEEGLILSANDLDRLRGPAGLDIGADSPEEIALSLLAEMQAVLAKRPGGALRERMAGIHDDDADFPTPRPNSKSPASIGVVILAAGGSTRLGRPKQLLANRGKTFLSHTIEAALQIPGAAIVAVIGAHASVVRPEVSKLPVTVVENADWTKGMGTSVRAGMACLQRNHTALQAVIFAVCDQPFISSAVLQQLIATHQNTGQPIVASGYGGLAGVPALFHRSLFPELLELADAEGARQILARHRENTALIRFPQGEIDVDTAAEYEAFLRTLDEAEAQPSGKSNASTT